MTVPVPVKLVNKHASERMHLTKAEIFDWCGAAKSPYVDNTPHAQC